jgi:DoxX-like family
VQAGTQNAPAASRKGRWAGRIITAIPVLFLLLDAIMKLMRPLPAPVAEGATRLGYPPSTMPVIGAMLLISVIIYAIPRTSVLGAILLTGYLGGAVASNVRVGNPLFSYVLAPVYVALFVWGGLFFRDDRVRALIPLRKPDTRH